MTELARKFSLVKPTLQTPFAIDFEWWQQHDSNWRVDLYSCLCEEHRDLFANHEGENVTIDRIDPETAEVQTVDGLQLVLMNHCSRQSDFVTSYTALVDTVFRMLLAHANEPMTPQQIADKTGRPADTILRTLAGPKVYKGIRPVHGG